MASAEKRFTELLDACLILAKSTKRNITKMEADIISKSPSAINKLSFLPVDTTTSFSCKKFLEAGPASKTPQSVSATESQTLLWLCTAGWPSLNPEVHACQPRGQTGRAPQEESSAANMLSGAFHTFSPPSGLFTWAVENVGSLMPTTWAAFLWQSFGYMLLPSPQLEAAG